MEAKYYTPEIEEFHVGFEYYFNDIGADGENLYDENRKAVIKDGTQIDDITRLQDGKPVYNLFVKHLDRQDIEELGWKYSNLSNTYSIELNDMSSVLTNGIWLDIQSNNRIKIIDCRLPRHEVVFNGYIKNKSELKKLMKMLNIETK